MGRGVRPNVTFVTFFLFFLTLPLITFLFAALIFLGIGTAISMVAFICEIVCAKISSD